MGNKIINAIENYNKINNKYPSESDYNLLQLIFTKAINDASWEYETFYPNYKTIDGNYLLIFIKGFDGPYLTYSNKEMKWELK